MKTLISIWLLLACASSSASASVEADLAYEKVAYRLELVRNQLELTVANQASLSNDLQKQQREFEAYGVFTRIPLASKDRKDKEILRSIREDFEKLAASKSGFKVAKVEFEAPWRSAPRRVPTAVNFDEGYRMPEEQLADQRRIELVLDFTEEAPRDPVRWIEEHRAGARRLLVPISTKAKGKRLTAKAWIYRFRDFDYPKMLAPDLSRYQAPNAPASPAQKAAATRIERYRREIPALWPKAQPFVDNIRQFALNDLRMNFFTKRASVHRH